MSYNQDLSAIFNRIANGEETERDMQTLRQLLRAREGQNSIQIGKYNVNISEGRDIQIGDRIYQGSDAEAIKEALRLVLQEKRKAERPRTQKLLLQAVKDEVVVRLKQSLHNAVLINLGKEVQPEQVKRPWSSDIKIGEKPSEPIPDGRSILEVFDQEEIAGKLLILGNPGAGKTTTMLDLAKALIARAEEDADYPIPVLFNLSNWKNDKQSMQDWLVLELKSKYGVRKDIGTKWVDDAKLLPMLDGLDELESVRQELCVRKINEFLQSEWRPQYLVVCSRWEEYTNYKINLQLNGAIFLQPLTDKQIQVYLTGLNQLELWKILQVDAEVLKLMRTSLFLSILGFISLHKALSLQEWQTLTSTQTRLEYLLDAYWETAIKRDIVTPKMESQGFKSRIYGKKKTPSEKQIQRWLVFLAQQLHKESQTEFLIEKMQPNYLKTPLQKWIFRLGIGTSIGLLSGLSVVMFLGVFETNEAYKNLIFTRNLGLVFGLFVGLSSGLMIGQYKTIQTIETLSWSWSKVSQNFATAPFFGLSAGLTSGKEIEIKRKPNQGICSSAANSLKGGLIFGLIGILFLGLSSGIGLGLMIWLRLGGTTCIQHCMLRLILRLNGYTPLYYARFLNYCTERILLQRVGGRYRFIHNFLQLHFAQTKLGK
ncbi:hypothetical protein PQG02_33190 (plasmid) [Nostoc sp. UHCC 0926]|uniref:NACHT domain-containing protein n=1 Tax=Nostoc sp. UHCC 0926 TaxID=3025190 RepID=UPI00235F0F78|nr:hypothetical protein [Nostoc sp. UHCC 0926]WDD36275.1 hypothetical protein PQG02_33190 [Nostoc sp. UHCC 0926]